MRILLAILLCAASQAAEPDPHRELVGTPRWGEEPETIESPFRSSICLNGLWRFLPAIDAGSPKPDASWQLIRVPGTWLSSWPLDPRPGLVLSDGATDPGPTTARAWYERTIRIPMGWTQRRVRLHVERLSTDAVVWLDDVECGRIRWPGGKIDLHSIRFGSDQRLRLLVAASRSPAGADRLLAGGELPSQPEDLDSRGLIGDVVMESLPEGPSIDDVSIITSTRKGEITVRCNVPEAPGDAPLSITLSCRNAVGTIIRSFPPIVATGNPRSATWSWADAPRWDADRAEMLQAAIEIQGERTHDAVVQPFGFREAWIDGTQLKLNGTILRLRATSSNEGAGVDQLIDAAIAGARSQGFNATQWWPWNHDDRGRWHHRRRFATRADGSGWAVIGTALMPTPSLLESDDAAFEIGFNDWQIRMRQEIAIYRNHPSILMWSIAGITYHDDNQNPTRIGSRSAGLEGTTAAYQRIFARTQRCVEAIRAVDPSRPVLVHNGAPAGDFYGANLYLGLTPAIEQAAWMDKAATGDMPVFVPELGLPMWASGMRGREGYPSASVSEPLLTEHAAAWIGPAAYGMETEEYRTAIAEHFIRDQQYRDFHNQLAVTRAPVFGHVGADLIRTVIRSWRAAGITGFIPWEDGDGWRRTKIREWEWQDAPPWQPGSRGVWLARWPKRLIEWKKEGGDRPTPAGDALRDTLRPTLAWIDGSADRPHLHQHHAWAGQPWQRSVVLINDTRQPQTYHGHWHIAFEGRIAAHEEIDGILPVGGILRLPIAIPALPTGTGMISLDVRIGQAPHQDGAGFRVLEVPPAGETAWIFDPQNRSEALLKRAGIAPAAADSPLLIIAERALSDGASNPPDLAAHLAQGKRALILSQDPDWMRRTWGLRIGRHVERRAWPLTHPIMAGIEPWDLRDWSGEGRLQPALTAPLTGYLKGFRDFPAWGWHLGNSGSVCSAPIEIPHCSGWRPLAVCGFDLASSPLMTLSTGSGQLLLCTFDLRAEDPVSVDVLKRIVGWTRGAPIEPRRPTTYLGGPRWRAQLESMGVILAKEPAAPGGLLLVGEGSPDAALLDQHLAAGGSVLVLARSGSPVLGASYRSGRDAGSVDIPLWPETVGLAPGDLRLRSELQGDRIADGGEVAANGLLARKSIGNGRVVWCQLDPGALPLDRTWLRLSRWRQTRALCQIIANLGGSFESDSAIPAGRSPAHGFYHPDWRNDHRLGDDPARYSKY